MMIKAPRGTSDILPKDVAKWNYIEQKFMQACHVYGFEKIMTPVFEHTELFERGVGDTTDVVQKEMYTFCDKGERSITLRPEGTASAVRAYLENGMSQNPQPTKLCYSITCYRHEKPQAGRLREFHQLGAECFGSDSPAVDAEMISLAMLFFEQMGLTGLELNLNSIGCPTCRAEYHKVLKNYLAGHYDKLCDTCKARFDKNPLRILDCKSEVCSEIAKGAPNLLNFLCDDCKTHFEAVKAFLSDIGIAYKIDGSIVRGLDYYTKTVFEIKAQNIGAQRTVCGGGRYDGLVALLGGNPTPGIGFALGVERLLLALEQEGVRLPEAQKPAIYIGSIGEAASREAQKMVFALRKIGVAAQKDLLGRSVKAQMKYADKLGVRYTTILGDNEIEQGKTVVKNMQTGEKQEVTLAELAETDWK